MVINHLVEQALSTARLDSYRRHTSTEDHAWALYRWNIAIAAALLPLAADLEVTLRNTVHDRLTDYFRRDDWWTSPTLVLDDMTNQMLAKAVRKHRKGLARGTVGPGKVVADTTLGVWVRLLGRGGRSALGQAIDYEAGLWRPALRLGFARGIKTSSGRERRPTRNDVHRRAQAFQRLRNRAVHHEPVFNGIAIPGTRELMPLDEVWERSIELLEWMNPELAALHRDADKFATLLAHRPTS